MQRLTEISTVMVTDIAYFTWLAEQVNPDVLWGQMAAYFEKLTQIIHTYNGRITHLAGDSIVAFFGVWPRRLSPADSAAAACRAAVMMLRRIVQINRFHLQRGEYPLVTRIAVNHGEIVAGSLTCSGADSNHQSLLILGDTINTAQRMQDRAKVYGVSTIIISHSILQVLDVSDRRFETRPLGAQLFPGKTQPVMAYQVNVHSCPVGPFVM